LIVFVHISEPFTYVVVSLFSGVSIQLLESLADSLYSETPESSSQPESTILLQSGSVRFNGQPAVDENEEFQLRRPSVSFITSPRVPKVCSNNNSDNMHLVTAKTEPIIRTVNVEGNQSESLDGVDIRFFPVLVSIFGSQSSLAL
jgi:hypothetical protein